MTTRSNLDFQLTCPAPLRRYPQIVLGHGGGGQMMHDLIEHLFVPVLYNQNGSAPLHDAAVLELNGPTAFTTDSFVVNPLIFPGGDIGSLSLHGTINDLAMMGAIPSFLSVSMILEEGLPMETLLQIVHSMATAAQEAGVSIVTGDTKVVERTHGDGIYINTAGVGIVREYGPLSPTAVRPDDVLIVNGTLGDHGMAIMCMRSEMDFESEIVSDSAALHTLVQTILDSSPNVHFLRDLTRGGLSAAVNELAHAGKVGVHLEEKQIPIRPAVAHACEILGIDPLQVANEGKLLAVVSGTDADQVLDAMHSHPLGKDAVIIGRVGEEHRGSVVCHTAFGSQRVLDMPLGILLPRIC